MYFRGPTVPHDRGHRPRTRPPNATHRVWEPDLAFCARVIASEARQSSLASAAWKRPRTRYGTTGSRLSGRVVRRAGSGRFVRRSRSREACRRRADLERGCKEAVFALGLPAYTRAKRSPSGVRSTPAAGGSKAANSRRTRGGGIPRRPQPPLQCGLRQDMPTPAWTWHPAMWRHWACSEFRVYAVLNRLKAELQTMSSTFTHRFGANGVAGCVPRTDPCRQRGSWRGHLALALFPRRITDARAGRPRHAAATVLTQFAWAAYCALSFCLSCHWPKEANAGGRGAASP